MPIALPTIKIKGKEYFIDERLQEVRSKVYPSESIEFINFGDLKKKDFNRVFDILHPLKKGDR